jgi:diguanylate cyclase (GGDEF)-like protein/PAS domain S-box-containing protein
VGEISIMRDITEQRRAEEALCKEQERARVTLDSIGDGVIATDMAGSVEYLNHVAEKLTGWRSAEARGCGLDEVFRIRRGGSGEVEATEARVALRWELRSFVGGEWTLISRTGAMVPIEDNLTPIRHHSGEVVGMVLAFRDVSEARKLQEQLAWQASHDELTGLVNRRDFERKLEAMVLDARRPGRQHALLCLDLDQFKVVNDTCGHAAGDELLRQMPAVLLACLRDTDVLARLGGDEFGVLLQRCDLERAAKVAEKLRAALLRYRFCWQSNTFSVGVSIGIAGICGDGESAAEILGSADAACFAAKDQGRNRVQVCRPGDSQVTQRRAEMQWVSRINQALEKNSLRLCCQRIAPVSEADEADEDAAHYEVLVRMVDDDGKEVPPMAFIPAAERYNLMPSVDRWVVSHAFAFLASEALALSGRPVPLMSINLSGSTLSDDTFPDFLRGQFRHYAVAPEAICFEVTETAAIANLARAARFMTRLKEFGCRFSLDDFGSGLSSFAYLKILPVDFLKIDGGFVKDMANDAIDYAMVEAINKVGHVMGLKTIAEFVENDVTLEMLKTIGIDYAQGYGIGRPQPIETLLEPAVGRLPQTVTQLRPAIVAGMRY